MPLTVTPVQFAIVSERALIKRINRKLATGTDAYSVRVLRKTRGESPVECGVTMNYYVLWCFTNTLESIIENIEAYGRGLGVLHDWEKLAE